MSQGSHLALPYGMCTAWDPMMDQKGVLVVACRVQESPLSDGPMNDESLLCAQRPVYPMIICQTQVIPRLFMSRQQSPGSCFIVIDFSVCSAGQGEHEGGPALDAISNESGLHMEVNKKIS
jgi:hypothetical protein